MQSHLDLKYFYFILGMDCLGVLTSISHSLGVKTCTEASAIEKASSAGFNAFLYIFTFQEIPGSWKRQKFRTWGWSTNWQPTPASFFSV